MDYFIKDAIADDSTESDKTIKIIFIEHIRYFARITQNSTRIKGQPW
jgi:hypothetical protein